MNCRLYGFNEDDMELAKHLNEGEFYHFFGRSTAKNAKLFYQPRNYDSFLINFSKYFSDYLDVWAYCLLPNHFHFLLRVKLKVDTTINDRWVKFSNNYSDHINKQENRCGQVFHKSTQFLPITDESHLLSLVKYINYNPVLHELVESPAEWRYSSHTKSAHEKLTGLKINKLMTIFDQTTAFKDYHYHPNEFKNIEYCLIE